MFPSSPNISLTLACIVGQQDSLGNKELVIKSSKEVVGISKSITSQEFQTSVMLSKQFDLKVVLQAFIYGGQKYAIIKDEIYKIERTFVNGQIIELYLILTQIKKEELRYDNKS